VPVLQARIEIRKNRGNKKEGKETNDTERCKECKALSIEDLSGSIDFEDIEYLRRESERA
jgi:hypothetical protein